MVVASEKIRPVGPLGRKLVALGSGQGLGSLVRPVKSIVFSAGIFFFLLVFLSLMGLAFSEPEENQRSENWPDISRARLGFCRSVLCSQGNGGSETREVIFVPLCSDP